ncbi:hypothetical protein QN277_007072 [Acacia crassicarpa]|uniref:Uncharacterized protein n=1 Tax=Acacia crassicarpa TaxID=499986 RepID=A0AAE1JQP0_9FABA|nr:hypothetical protein QN277_007072 [Acacia crassicarpa]
MADHDRDLLHLSREDKVRSSFNCLPRCCFRNSSQHLKIKCSDFISRIGARDGRRRSASFHYDPLSYAMNFEDDTDDRYVDSLIRRDFAGRSSSSTRISSSSDSSRPRELAVSS